MNGHLVIAESNERITELYNIARDPREQMNQVGTEAWVIASYMKIIGAYKASLEEHPNPPAFSLTEF